LTILYEDRDLIVVNKPPGLVVHPAAGHACGTLVNGLLHHCPDLVGIGGERRPGIVHRLDKDTSGVMVVAKNNQAHQGLSQSFKDRRIQKIYLAIVMGCPDQAGGTIDLPVGRHPMDRKKMSVNSPRGRIAVTNWQVREQFPGAALLALELKTGRTHQIRVHCQSMGHPIVGDPIYGSKRGLQHLDRAHSEVYAVLKQAQRQMLHAARLGFVHPVSGQFMTFEAALPQDMALLIEALRGLGGVSCEHR
ncbi:MAG: RluA family pseudouridine synthase, partial [Desulfobacteraceae bacterium]|nr:RluA family pseudouridine synthase [Desulfobacteraceae bacterium]